MIARKTFLSRWWHNYWADYYTRQMLLHKKVAEYNLYRHNEAVDNYNRKKSSRENNKSADDTMGYYIANENADSYAASYNEHWMEYIDYKHKLEVLQYETPTAEITSKTE
jgi:hypothetical protein